MKNILQQFIRFPFYGKMVIFLLVFFGFYSFNSMKKSSFPESESKTITVSVAYMGASPKQMEDGITKPIENSLRGLPGIKEMTSSSAENSTVVTVTVKKDEPTESVLRDVKNAVDGISSLPSAADRPIVSWNKNKSPALFFSLTGKKGMIDLKAKADLIEDELMASGVVSQVSYSGFKSLELSIEISEHNIQRYGITIEELKSAIANNNLDISGGTIRNAREQINIISRMRSVDPEKIEQIIIKTTESGSVIRIKDIAEVKYQFAEGPTASFVNGEPTINFQVMKLNSEDLIEISEHVANYVKRFNNKETDYQIDVLFDFSSILNQRIDILSSNGIIGIILVIVFLSLFLNTRLSLWVAWGIPASFLGMFIIAHMAGITINMLSLFGMIMVIGILVDDGVVIGENVYSHFERGKSPKQAAYDGTVEVLPAIFTSVSTTIVAFVPLLFLTGHMSMMKDMSIVVIACLALSLIEGIFILPGHLSNEKVLNNKNEFFLLKKMRVAMDKFLLFIRDRLYAKSLTFILKYKWASLAASLSFILLTAGMVMGGKIGITFFPNMEEDYFTIDLALKPGTSTEITKFYLLFIEKKALEVSREMELEYKEKNKVIRKTQLTTGGAYNGSESGTHAGRIAVMIGEFENARWSISELKRRIAEKIGVIEAAQKFSVGASNRMGAPVSISLLSRDENQLHDATEWFKTELNKIEALFNVMDNNRIGSQEIRLIPKEKAYVLGLTQQSLMNQVRNSFYGAQSQRMVEGKNEIRVYVRFPKIDRDTQGELENLKIKTPKGTFLLAELAEFSLGRSPVVISRLNGQREVTVSAYQKDPSKPLGPVNEMVNASLLPQINKKFPNVTYAFRGQMKDSKEEGNELASGFFVAFIVIVLIIMLSFRSFYQGILILLVVPLGWVAAIWGHGIEGIPLSLLSAFGIVALSGTIINDAVVFLAKFNQDLQAGMKIDDALMNTARSRFRPILLTSVTTVAGLYPLILETSIQAQFLIPMAVSLAYGIFIGTIFVMLFFPVFIKCGNRINRKLKNLFSSKHYSEEEIEPAIIQQKLSQD